MHDLPETQTIYNLSSGLKDFHNSIHVHTYTLDMYFRNKQHTNSTDLRMIGSSVGHCM